MTASGNDFASSSPLPDTASKHVKKKKEKKRHCI
jgi:hypothetical protein